MVREFVGPKTGVRKRTLVKKPAGTRLEAKSADQEHAISRHAIETGAFFLLHCSFSTLAVSRV
jgi:hypothetical protein